MCSLSYPARNAYVPYCHLWPALLYNFFTHYLKHGTFFEKRNVTEHKMCVLIVFINLSETFLILRRIERDMVKLCICLHLKYPVFLSDFNET
jgi:hypothetical protein